MAVAGYAVADRISSRVNGAVAGLHSYMNGLDLNTSAGHRLTMYKGGLEIASSHPWLGVGRENVNEKLLETSVITDEVVSITDYSHLHNEYLTTLAGSGVFGLCSLLLLLVAPCVLVYRATGQGVLRGQVMTLCALYSVYGLTNLTF